MMTFDFMDGVNDFLLDMPIIIRNNRNVNMNLQVRLKECMAEKSARDGKEVKKAHLANALGKPRATVSAWLSGSAKSIYGTALFDVANYFGVEPNWLQSGVGDKYASGNKNLREKLNQDSCILDENNLNNSLVNENSLPMLGGANTVKQLKSPTKEETMSLHMIQQMYNIDRPNVLHAISLLLILNEAKDDKRIIKQAIDALSLSLDDTQGGQAQAAAKKAQTTP